MRYAALIFALGLCPLSAQAALLTPSEIDASRYLPPPPSRGSADEKAEFQELKAIAARSTPEEFSDAARDAKDETPDIFNAAIGFDIAAKPATFKLLQLVAEEEETDSKLAKTYFHRPRPYSVDASIKTCEPVKPGKAANSYPSGHASLAFSMGVVLASLIPLARAAVEEFSPLLGELAEVGGPDVALALEFSVSAARDEAWRAATLMSLMPPDARPLMVDALDARTKLLGRVVADPPEPVGAVVRRIQCAESTDVVAIITALDALV